MNGYDLFIGVGSGEGDGGIFHYQFSPEEKMISFVRCEDEFTRISYLTCHPNKRLACAVSEDGAVGLRTYWLHPDSGRLEKRGGFAPTANGLCHVSIAPEQDRLFVSSYTEGQVCVYPLWPDGTVGKATGRVTQVGSSVNYERQEGSHTHSVFPSVDGKVLVVCDLGADTLTVYRLKEDGDLERCQVWKAPPGSGPRHFEFHPNGKWGYLLTELSAEVTFFTIDANGVFHARQTIPSLPEEFCGENLAAEIRLSANQRFLYVSNRGHNSVVWFSVASDGHLERLGEIRTKGWPRELDFSWDGKFLFVLEERSKDTEGGVEAFPADIETGALQPTGTYAALPNAQTFFCCESKELF